MLNAFTSKCLAFGRMHLRLQHILAPDQSRYVSQTCRGHIIRPVALICYKGDLGVLYDEFIMHGVQGRMISVDNCFVFFGLL